MFGIAQSSTDRILSANRSVIEKNVRYDWLPQELLGCGHYGCVYSTSDPKVVVKVSTDPTEYTFIQLAMGFGEWPEGIVRYYQVLELSATYRKREVFMVWRESAFDVGDVAQLIWFSNLTETERFDAYQQKRMVTNLDIFKTGAENIRKAINKIPDPANFIKTVVQQREYFVDFIEWFHGLSDFEKIRRIEARFKGLNRQSRLDLGLQMINFALESLQSEELSIYVGEALQFYLDRGVLLADVHTGNIGRVEREDFTKPIVVITDPGHAVLLSDGQVL